MRTRSYIGGGAAALILMGAGVLALQQPAVAQGSQAPKFEVDRLWPKPLGNHWIPGSFTGIAIDAQDHIWTVNRGLASLQGNEKGPTQTPWASECCFAAPQVMEFDAAGTLMNHWGGPGQGYTWPQAPGGIAVDSKGNVWITAAGIPAAPAGRGRGPAPAAGADARGGRGGAGAAGGAAPARGGAAAAAPAGRGGAAPAARGGAPAAPPQEADAHVLEFSSTGQFIRQIGTPGKMEGPDSQTTLDRPKAIAVDSAANEVYVGDSGNRRVVVFDSNTGAFKRMWGGSGDKPSATAPAAGGAPDRQFRDVNCIVIAKDGMVYVCDSPNNRIQVFDKQGKFVKEGTVKAGTGGEVIPAGAGGSIPTESFGSAWAIAFSNDAQQRFLYVADGQNKTVWILQRDSLTPVSRFAEGGRYPGTVYAVDSIGVDSKGNVYTGEGSEGKRVQKWIYKGMGAPASLAMN